MKNIAIAWCGLAAVALLAASGAWGQPAVDAQRCATIENDPDLAIAICTRAIESGRISGEALAKLHLIRGAEWAGKGDHDRAIADYDAAIRLKPRSADVFFNRGSAWAIKGEPDRAIADYDAAIRLDPKEPTAYGGRAVAWAVKGDYARAIADFDTAIRLNPMSSSSFFGRGRTRFYSGEFQRAAADLERAHKLNPSVYTALWVYLARKRGSLDGDEALKAYAGAGGSAWPAPLLALYLGKGDPETVLAAPARANPVRQPEQRCEATFYLAQWHLVRGERERALPLLKEAQDGCPRNFMEYEGAVAELRRLRQR
jgi:lipoprotein NlpI